MSGPRPAVVVLVVGTGTDVGKTWVAARLLESWRATGRTVAARKPAQSFAPGTGPTDADVLGAASGEDATTVCPAARWYPVPLAPPMAAAALDLPVPTMADLTGELVWPDGGVDIGLVETAGGVRSPQAGDGDVRPLHGAVAPDAVVLVADAGLGTLNAVRLSLDALTATPAPSVVLNRFDLLSDVHRRNLEWLRGVDDLGQRVVTDGDLDALAARLAPEGRA